jgi:hypothetical protein
MLDIDAFLTAYDPSDLPGASIDPMGFERGYLYLAEKILPALTNVAAVPRYFSMLCAGTSMAKVSATASVREQSEARRATAMRLERLWALANYLAAQQSSAGLSGLRGVRYVAAEAHRLEKLGQTEAEPDYKLLSRQAPYGVLGIYGAVAEELKFFSDRDAMELSPDAGLRLAESFREETKMPAKLERAVLGEGTIALSTLTKWGEAAFMTGPHGIKEAICLNEALVRDPVRARMCALLANRPFVNAESESDRLKAIATQLMSSGPEADLRDAITVILAYEAAFAWVVLGFERLLWLCREATVPLTDPTRSNDPILRKVAEALPSVVRKLEDALTNATTAHVGAHPEPLVDVREFLRRAVEVPSNVAVTSEVIFNHHADVQRGKFDRGKRKLPWLERTPAGITLTMTRVGGAMGELTSHEQIRPHFYRLAAADAFIAARDPS